MNFKEFQSIFFIEFKNSFFSLSGNFFLFLSLFFSFLFEVLNHKKSTNQILFLFSFFLFSFQKNKKNFFSLKIYFLFLFLIILNLLIDLRWYFKLQFQSTVTTFLFSFISCCKCYIIFAILYPSSSSPSSPSPFASTASKLRKYLHRFPFLSFFLS